MYYRTRRERRNRKIHEDGPELNQKQKQKENGNTSPYEQKQNDIPIVYRS